MQRVEHREIAFTGHAKAMGRAQRGQAFHKDGAAVSM